ncbi:MAG: hypothetical protein M0R40_09325 [Firmicutes bacterium]|nr:hypothetical protein [Bacillota bacterium]
MSLNDTGKNIANACKIVFETCANVERLIAFLNEQAAEKEEYAPCTLKPLRFRGDSAFNDEAIFIFQKKREEKSLYVVNISLWGNVNDDETDEAKIYLSKFEYANTLNLKQEPILKSNYYQFADPIYESGEIVNLKFDGEYYKGSVRGKTQADEDYRGLRRVVGFSIPLTSITADNAYSEIFGGFDKLAKKCRT